MFKVIALTSLFCVLAVNAAPQNPRLQDTWDNTWNDFGVDSQNNDFLNGVGTAIGVLDTGKNVVRDGLNWIRDGLIGQTTERLPELDWYDRDAERTRLTNMNDNNRQNAFNANNDFVQNQLERVNQWSNNYQQASGQLAQAGQDLFNSNWNRISSQGSNAYNSENAQMMNWQESTEQRRNREMQQQFGNMF